MHEPFDLPLLNNIHLLLCSFWVHQFWIDYRDCVSYDFLKPFALPMCVYVARDTLQINFLTFLLSNKASFCTTHHNIDTQLWPQTNHNFKPNRQWNLKRFWTFSLKWQKKNIWLYLNEWENWLPTDSINNNSVLWFHPILFLASRIPFFFGYTTFVLPNFFCERRLWKIDKTTNWITTIVVHYNEFISKFKTKKSLVKFNSGHIEALFHILIYNQNVNQSSAQRELHQKRIESYFLLQKNAKPINYRLSTSYSIF